MVQLALIFILAVILAGNSAQTADVAAPNAATNTPLRIIKIEPNTGTAGEIVRLTASIDLGQQTNLPRVEFNNKLVPVAEVSDKSVSVQVPEGLTPGSNPEIVLIIGQIRSEPSKAFTIAATAKDRFGVYFPWIFWGVILTIAGIGYWRNFWRGRRAKREQENLKRQLEEWKNRALQGDLKQEIEIAVPDPPDELVKAIVRRDCILYAGPGLSTRAGYPAWKQFVVELLEWAESQKFLDERFSNDLRVSLESGSADAVADTIASATSSSTERRQQLHDFLSQTFIHPNRQPPESHSLLQRLRFASVLTTNYDSLLETTFLQREPKVYTPTDSQALLTALTKNEFFILKLYGRLEVPHTVLIAPEQYKEMISNNRPFAEFMNNLFFSRTILFVGVTLKSVTAHLVGIGQGLQGSSQPAHVPERRHYALVAVEGEGWKADAELLLRRYGIQVLPYTARSDEDSIAVFLNRLVEKVRAVPEPDPAARGPQSRLKQVTLKNIGLFRELQLQLDPHWNVLLGDNGLGKSTVLKAIALAIAGKDGEPYADRLIRLEGTKKVPSGNIIIQTDSDKSYITEISMTTIGDTVVNPVPFRALEQEKWLVIGYPAIRTLTWERKKDIRDEEQKRRPTPLDVLPILIGLPDPRMNELKEWILNLDYHVQRDSSSYHQALLKKFFEIINVLLHPMKLDDYRVDHDTKRIYVRTQGAEIPLEALSQGTTSLLGWIGVLLQRLYEVYGGEANGSGGNPADRYALILVDEIDAHMHPYWQKTLVHKLIEKFKNLQFIVTSHSPLIVGGLEPRQVWRLRKSDDGNVVAERPEGRLKGKGVSGLLTSDLFDLSSQLDEPTEILLDEKRKITSKPSLDDADRDRVRKLDESLGDIDFTARDPLFEQFVKAMYESKTEQRPRMPLTKEEEQKRNKIAEEIVQKLKTQKSL